MTDLKIYGFVLFFLFTVMTTRPLMAQSPKLSKYEYSWAFIHPINALKANKISRQCDLIYNASKSDVRLDTYLNGGKLDAYRHIFYMAAFTQKINYKKVQKLGTAHEKNNYHQFLRSETEFGDLADSMSCVMDLKNNMQGIKIGLSHKKLSLTELSEFVINEIRSGRAYILKRDAKGQFLTCEDQIIDLKRYAKKWFVPKCLVSSAEIAE